MSDLRHAPDPDAPPTPEEEAAAAALAGALEPRAPQAVPPELAGALAALRAAAPAAPGQAAPARVLAAVPRPARWRWLLPVGGLATAAAAAALVLLVAPPRPAALPAPGRELLLAQAEAARGSPRRRWKSSRPISG
ncbi:MAG TPA: hypothetical protein P5076_18410, partial [Myxococcota bacterium]|nr:hypothetical protein [Myxococcota bacterium]